MSAPTTKPGDPDDSIAIIYKGDALGKEVFVKFKNEQGRYDFYKGVVTRMEARFPNDKFDPAINTDSQLEYIHYIKFGDGDDAYYDLSHMEMTGCLKWTNSEEEAEVHHPQPAAAVVTPEKKRKVDLPETENQHPAPYVVVVGTDDQHPAAATVASDNKRKAAGSPANRNAQPARVKIEPGSTLDSSNRATGATGNHTANTNAARVKLESESNYAKDAPNDAINLQEFQHWLENIHRGAKGGKLSQYNVHGVMNRVQDFTSGRGVSYRNWPSNVVFCPGVKVGLSFDFHQLLQQAKAFERTHGRDLGNGWLLQHPIKKLLLYKQHLEEFGYRKRS